MTTDKPKDGELLPKGTLSLQELEQAIREQEALGALQIQPAQPPIAHEIVTELDIKPAEKVFFKQHALKNVRINTEILQEQQKLVEAYESLRATIDGRKARRMTVSIELLQQEQRLIEAMEALRATVDNREALRKIAKTSIEVRLKEEELKMKQLQAHEALLNKHAARLEAQIESSKQALGHTPSVQHYTEADIRNAKKK